MMAMQETYRDVQITLLEDENKWRFTANGRERTAPTLPKAREYIDNALDAVESKKEKPWEPIDAYWLDVYPRDLGTLDKGRITSIAGRDYRGRTEVWFSGTRRGRCKTSLENLCVVTPENESVFQEMRVIETETERQREL